MALGFNIGMWRSLVARLLWVQDVVGSNPIIPTNRKHSEDVFNFYKKR